jgi:septum formation protein
MESDLMQGKQKSPIILASASLRRRELLTTAGYEFTVVKSAIDESKFSAEGIEPYKFAEQLALAKANDVAREYPDKIVIGADTIVDYAGQIIGKPEDEVEARQIIENLFSSPHKVITGLAIVRLCDDTELVAHDSTTVYPKQLTQEQISQHIEIGLWKNKSGAYAIRENGDEFVEKIDGSLTNVMGLPMELLESLLKQVLTRK